MADSIQFRFHSEGLDVDTFEVVRFSGSEGLSQLYRFHIDLITQDPDSIDIDSLQDTTSTFSIHASGQTRVVRGLLAQVETLDRADGGQIFRVTLVPRVWELTRGTINKIYLDTQTPDVIRQVLDQAGITEADYQFDLSADYRDWEFRFQYGESYWDFLSRALERDGIYYYFVPGEADTERVCFCDTWREQPELDKPDIRFARGLGFGTDDGNSTVHSLVARRSRVLRKITLQNYNDAKPSTRIRSEAEVDPKGTGEDHIYGQKVLDQAEADALAAIRAEEIRWQKEQFHGESTVCAFAAGYRFELTEHPRASNNQAYQLVQVEHQGYDPRAARMAGEAADEAGAVYENTFTAIPDETQFRPVRRTDRPVVTGTLNARIDAEGDGEYAELDEEGRYHVIFPFDTEHPSGRASHWVRLMQPYAGEQEGMHFPLRKRARVLISFLAGDPDLPVISGAIPNSEQPSVTTSDNQTTGGLRTPQGNWLETDDTWDRERFECGSPNSRTMFRLGADFNPLQGAQSLSAAAQYDVSSGDDPDADGILLESKGMSRTAYFGGSNSVSTTDQWSVSTTLWDDTQDRREDEIELSGDDALGNLPEYSSGTNWRVKHGQNRVFPFPRKHNLDQSETELTVTEESNGSLHVSRTLGDSYTYTSGTSFSFTGADYESFDFGPSASFTSADHAEDSEQLRQIVRDTLPEIWDGSDYDSSVAQKYKRLYEMREEIEQWRKEHGDRTRRRDTLQNDGETQARDQFGATGPVWGFPPMLWSDRDHPEEWATLQNFSTSGYSVAEYVDSDGNSLGHSFTNSNSIWSLPNAKKSPPDNDSIQFAENTLNEKQTEYDDEFGDPADGKTPTSVQGREWLWKMRDNRLNVKTGDDFLWHNGNVYDFGGNWSYSLGNGYSEAHSDQAAALDSSDHDYDLLTIGGPSWIGAAAPWHPRHVDPEVKAALGPNDQVIVDKTVADTYSYHNGAALDVHNGPSLSVSTGGPNVSRSYSPSGQLTEHVKSASGVTETWRNHRDSGAPMYYGRETWGVSGHGAGKNSFSTEFAPSISLDIKCAMEQSNEINLAFAVSTALNVGASVGVNIYVGAKMDISISAAAAMDVNVFAAAKMDISVGTGVIIEYKQYGGVKVEADGVAPALKLSFPGGTYKMENAQKVTLGTAVAALKQFPPAEIGNKQIEVDIGNFKLES